MIISVDHGNKSIKTPNTLFTSGLISSEGLQGFKTDYICWNGRYYTLTEQRISYLRDKTEDERFYVLTLFAIAKELERRKAAETLDPIDITLLIGLPPAHYEQLHSRFEQYFLRRREAIDFEYNGKYYSIRISKVLSYPQAFAAAVTQYSTLKTYSVAYIIDIGGFTIDVLKLRNGRPDLAVVESFEKGVITLYNSITSKCNALYARILEDCDTHNTVEEAFFQKCVKELNENKKLNVQQGKPIRAINVGCMMPYMNYEPRTLKEILSAQNARKE